MDDTKEQGKGDGAEEISRSAETDNETTNKRSMSGEEDDKEEGRIGLCRVATEGEQ